MKSELDITMSISNTTTMYSMIYKYIFVSSIAGVNRTRRRSEHCKNLCTYIILYRTYMAAQCCTDYKSAMQPVAAVMCLAQGGTLP